MGTTFRANDRRELSPDAQRVLVVIGFRPVSHLWCDAAAED
jgi:hypothetical protein